MSVSAVEEVLHVEPYNMSTGEALSLNQLHPHHWHYLLKFLSLADKKNLRLVNKAIYNSITELEKSFKHAYKKNPITQRQLRQLADDCPTLIGLECTLRTQELEGLVETMNYLHKKHPSIEIKMRLEGAPSFGQLRQLADNCPALIGLECTFYVETSEVNALKNDRFVRLVRKNNRKVFEKGEGGISVLESHPLNGKIGLLLKVSLENGLIPALAAQKYRLYYGIGKVRFSEKGMTLERTVLNLRWTEKV